MRCKATAVIFVIPLPQQMLTPAPEHSVRPYALLSFLLASDTR